MNIGHIGDWIKAHPWMAGIIVVVGGLAFILISGWFSNSSASTPVYVGGTVAQPSDASIAAGAQVQQAQISAGVATHQSDNALAVANLQAGVTSGHDLDALQLGLSQITASLQLGSLATNASRDVQLAGITAQQQVQTQSIAAQQNVANHQLDYEQSVASYGAQTTQASIAANENLQQGLISYLSSQADSQFQAHISDNQVKEFEDQLSNAQWLYSAQQHR